MKKLRRLLIVSFVSLFVFTQLSSAQNVKGSVEKSFKAELEKQEFLFLEPIAAEFRLTLPSTEKAPGILKGVSIKIDHNETSRKYRGLTLYVTQGEPQSPGGNNTAGPRAAAEVRPYDSVEEEVIDRVGEFFPEAGDYRIQFFLDQPEGRAIFSNAIDIKIKEPVGLEKEALDFLKQREDALSFNWVWKEKDGPSVLESFVNSYRETVYGGLASQYLANIYLAKGDLIRAQAEFEKLKTSDNKVLGGNAARSLADIERRKASQKKP